MTGMRVVLLCVAVAVGGCGATGPKYSEIKGSIPELDPEHGRIYFYRSSGAGPLVQPDIRLNGTVVGEMTTGGFFFVDRLPGTYTATASTEVEARAQFPLEGKQTQYVRGSISLGILVGRPNFELVDPRSAAAELTDLVYTGKTLLQPGATGISASNLPLPADASSGGSTKMKDLEGLLQDRGSDKK